MIEFSEPKAQKIDFPPITVEPANSAVVVPVAAKKKKNKKKKAQPAVTQDPETIDESQALKAAPQAPKAKTPAQPKKAATGAWSLPNYTVPDLFPNGGFPTGEIVMYRDDNLWRTTSAEKRELERLHMGSYEAVRQAAEVHRRVRQDAQKWIKPGMKMIDICKRLEATNKHLVKAKGLECGIAFPTGCSINRCAAHYTPNTGDDTVLGIDDVVKFDFGTHVNGYIVDCAWTMAWNPQFDPLIKAVKEATNTGIKEAGIDARLNEIGAAIQEVMESYEVTINGKTTQVKSIRNLSGHSIDPYIIHGYPGRNKQVPIVKGQEVAKMEEGEFYAIETFGTTGSGRVNEEGDCSHYMREVNPPFAQLRTQRTKQLYSYITKTYSTLGFCRRWLDEDGQDQNLAALRQLVQAGLVTQHPPLCDTKGSYTAQFEHTILLRPTCKEVISRGDDY